MTIQKLSAGDLRTVEAAGTIVAYTGVVLGSGGTVIAVSATSDLVYGIAQEAAVDEGILDVAVGGISKMRASDAVAIGVFVGCTSSAEAVTVTAGSTDGQQSIGMCVKAAAANDEICSVDLDRHLGWLLLDNS